MRPPQLKLTLKRAAMTDLLQQQTKVFTLHDPQANCSPWSPNKVLFQKEREMKQEMQRERMKCAG